MVVPLLIWLLDYDAKHATATSLAGIVITAVVGASTHGALGNVDVAKAVAIGIPAVVGVLAGVALKERLSSRSLTLGFAAFLVLVAVRMFLPAGGALDIDRLAVETAVVAGVGLVAGIVAGLFGVGGGILFVPALTVILGLSQIRATGTSLLAMIPVSLLGTWRQRRGDAIHWRDAATVGIASTTTALAGAFLADVTPGRLLRTLFAVLVLVTAFQLAARARTGR